MAYENNEKRMENVYSKKVRAGKKRTYFFDIKETRNNAYSLIITESRRRFDDKGYDRSSIFIYPEDVNKFAKGLNEAIEHIKTELLPDYNFEEFDNEYDDNGEYIPREHKAVVEPIDVVIEDKISPVATSNVINPTASEEVDKW